MQITNIQQFCFHNTHTPSVSIILFKRLLLTSNYFTLITMFMIKQHIRAFQRQLKESFHWQEFITPAHCSLLSSGSKSAFRWMLCSRCLWLLALPAARYLLNTHSLFFHIQICFFFSSTSTVFLSFLCHSWREMREVTMKRKRRRRMGPQRRKTKVRNSTRLEMDWQLMRRRTRMAALDACLHQRTSAGQRQSADSCSVWVSIMKMWLIEQW